MCEIPTAGTGMPASQEWNVSQPQSVDAKPQHIIEAEIDSALKRVKRATHRAEVDSIVQALVRTGGAAEMRSSLNRRLGRAVLFQSDEVAALYVLSALFSLFGLVEVGQQSVLLTITPEVESTEISSYGKLQLLLTAFRSGLSNEAEVAMTAMLDFRDCSDHAYLLSLWTYCCVLGALKMDIEDYWDERSLAHDGMRLAVILEDPAKYERNWFSYANASAFVTPKLPVQDAFEPLRDYRNQGNTSLNFVLQQLALLYSARDACARGDLKQAERFLLMASEEKANFPPLAAVFYQIELGRLALANQQERAAHGHLIEAVDFLQKNPNTLGQRVLQRVNQGLDKPLVVRADSRSQNRDYKKAIARLTSTYKRSWRLAVKRGLIV